ncbi:hypothetical protein M0R72_14150 [Candidatus Pacearchaeota archaeon]|jgi:hypothetical protein|nr:hypothetical protein [Candidatus Pacearchaeota archaeon]
MKKIGVLVFSNKNSISVGRDCRSDYSFDGISGRGFKKILAELNRPYEYCSTETINNYSDVLCSLTSYHDVLNLVLNIPINKKAQVHIGGPACNNIRPILPYIDSANFGRCDNGKINGIIDGSEYQSVWYKSNDPKFEGKYEVDASSAKGLDDDEHAYGCRQKCSFCFYSHWNKHTEKNASTQYSSGFSTHEDFFQSLKWEKCLRGGVTALDGITEETRIKVRKMIRRKDIIDTMLKSNDIKTNTRLRVKVYCIAGYPWEDKNEIEKLDLLDVLQELYADLRNQITIRMHFSHFIPFQKTPLWNVRFNFANYRDYCLGHKLLFDKGGIRLFSGGTFTPSPSPSAQSTIIQRASNEDTKIIEKLASPKFQSMSSAWQIRVMSKELPRFFCEQESETIHNIKTPNQYNQKSTK